MNAPLLSRYAEGLFWMARYNERAENLARILDVTRMFSPLSRGVQNWGAVVALHCDDEAFEETYGEVTERNVIRFYVADDRHPSSIYSCIVAARVNANRLRPIVSTELWTQLNVFYNEVKQLAQLPVERDLDPLELPMLFSQIRTNCQTHTGIAEGTFVRDAGWYFYLLGKNLERADKITRLLDIKYHLLLPSLSEVGSIIDLEQWYSILRIVGGYQAFRIRYAHRIEPRMVAGFLLKDDSFSRSVLMSVISARRAFERLCEDFGHADLHDIRGRFLRLENRLHADTVDDIFDEGLHEYLDGIQLQLIAISERIAEAYF